MFVMAKPKYVLVCAVPDFLGNVTAVVQIHTHTLLLRALSSEDVSGHWLLHFGLTEEHLVLGILVDSLDLDDLATSNHANVLHLDVDVVVGQHHADKRGMEASDTSNIVLSSPGLDQASHCGTGVHAVRDGARQVGVVGEDSGDVDRVEVTRDTSVALVGCRSPQQKRGLAAQRNGVLEHDGLLNGRAIALQVVNDWVAVRLARRVVNRGDLDDLLRRQLDQNLATGLNSAEDSLRLEVDEGLKTEDQDLAKKVHAVSLVIQLEPLLGLEHSNILAGGQVNLHRSLVLALEGVLERLGTRHHAELVGKVDQLQQITVDGAREDGLSDGLPSDDNGKVHRRVHDLARSVNECFAVVADGVHEVIDGLARNSRLATIEPASNKSVKVHGLVAKPCSPVELLNAVVASLHDLMDRSVTSLRVVSELERERNGLAKCCRLLDHVDHNLVLSSHLDLKDVHIVVVTGLLLEHDGRLFRRVRVHDLHEQPTARGKNSLHGVCLILLALHQDLRHQESMSPRTLGTGEQRQPVLDGRQWGRGGSRDAVGVLVAIIGHSDTFEVEWNLGVNKLASEVLDCRDLGRVTLVDVLGQVLNVAIVDAVENVLDRLVSDSRVPDCRWSLKDTRSANVLVDDSIEILGLPKRVLLEEELEVLVQGRHEGDGLLPAPLAQHQEVLDILGVDDLLVGLRVVGQNLLHGRVGLVKVGVALQKRRLSRGSRETLLDTVNEITSELGVGRINPTGLVLDVQKLDQSPHNLAVGHVLEINSLTGLVLAEPDLLEVLIELLDDVGPVLLELSDTLFLRQAEDLLVHLGPELDTTSGKLVNGLTHLRADGDDTSSSALAKSLDILLSDLNGRNTSADGETLDRDTLSPQTPDQGDLPAHSAGVDVDEVDTDTATSRNGLLNLLERSSHGLSVVVATASQLDVVPRLHSGRDEVPWNRAGSHTSNHDGWNTKQSAHLGVHESLATGVLDQLGAILLDPVDGILDSMLLIAVKKLGLVSSLSGRSVDSTGEDDANASALLVAAGENTQTRNTARTEIEHMGGVLEDSCLLPVDGVAGDEANQSWHDIAFDLLANVLSGVGIVDRDAKRLGVNLDVLEVFVDHSCRFSQVLAVEGRGDGQETVDESDLSLGVRNSCLVQAGGRLDLSELQVETVQGHGRTRHNHIPGAVDE
ncbi:hypothetical protein VMCG_05231 [Cytospora schulzeri]|uniref:Uncharacterized protein n=1 Tax=Cytospora schulzeri TaxID=448051 RepID=A0A423WR12_9PEZI|nr:hypothetical protein VMCG_05231 [Valsa malicola]